MHRIATALCFVVVVLVPGAVAVSAMPVYVRTIGAADLVLPLGVAIGSDGDVFVVDQATSLVRRYQADGTAVASWSAVTGLMSNSGQVMGIESDRAGTLWVSFAGYGPGGLIRQFTESGVLTGDYSTDGLGHSIVSPWGMGYDLIASTLVIADMSSGLWKLSGGTLTHLPNGDGCGPGQLHSATGVAAIGSHDYETEYSERLQEIRSDGLFLHELGDPTGCGDIRGYPRFVTPFNGVTLMVSDMLTSQLRLIGTNGSVLGTWGSPGSAHGQFSGPAGCNVDFGTGEIFVADAWNHRVEVYGTDPTPATTASWGAVKIRYR